jgi:hypothetical protein
VATSPAFRRKLTQPKDAQRSRIANGSALLPGVDGRSTWVRRCKELIVDHVSDLGGDDNVSTAERSLIRRAAVLTTELERLEVKFALASQASDSDLDLYVRASGNLKRLLEAVGLQRRAKVINAPTLQDYMSGRRPLQAAE